MLTEDNGLFDVTITADAAQAIHFVLAMPGLRHELVAVEPRFQQPKAVAGLGRSFLIPGCGRADVVTVHLGADEWMAVRAAIQAATVGRLLDHLHATAPNVVRAFSRACEIRRSLDSVADQFAIGALGEPVALLSAVAPAHDGPRSARALTA